MEIDKIHSDATSISLKKRSGEEFNTISCKPDSSHRDRPVIDPCGKVDVLPTIVIIDDTECIVTAAANIEGGSHTDSHRTVESSVNNQLMMNRDQTAPHANCSAFVAHQKSPPNKLDLPSPPYKIHTLPGSALQPSETGRDDRVKVFTANREDIADNHRKRKRSRAKKMDYFHRRSHSHPEQLNLMSEEEEVNSWRDFGNWDTPNPALLRKHSLPHDNLHFSNIGSSSEEKTKFCADADLNKDDPTGTDSGFADPLSDTEKDEEENLWNRPSEFKLRDQFYSFFQASDNKLAMKLFGSRNALLKEKKRQMEARTWIIHPCSNFR